MKLQQALPCIVCKGKLKNYPIDEEGRNQPNDGLEFLTSGHYPSTIIDIFDGRTLRLNVCDPCLLNAARENLIAVDKTGTDNALLEYWTGPEQAA